MIFNKLTKALSNYYEGNDIKVTGDIVQQFIFDFYRVYYETNSIPIDDVSLIDKINNGYCMVLAYYVVQKLRERNIECNIVNTPTWSHTFFYIVVNGCKIYFDAYMSKGTKKVLDIVDAGEGDLIVVPTGVVEEMNHKRITKWSEDLRNGNGVYYSINDIYTYMKENNISKGKAIYELNATYFLEG